MSIAGDIAAELAEKPLRAKIDALTKQRDELLAALEDMNNGWKYIRSTHGDLYGVGWNRAQNKADAAIASAKGGAA